MSIPPPDHAARLQILCEHERGLLVEAGAGSGKTALLAGRVALMLAAGVDAQAIVAITFTEAAAAELFERIEGYVAALAAGEIPFELQAALPRGLTARERTTISQAKFQLDHLSCTTIHGFCQQIIKPYPLETGLDPGAQILEPQQAAPFFESCLEGWLRKRLDVPADAHSDILVALAAFDPAHMVTLVRQAARLSASHSGILPSVQIPEQATSEFIEALNEYVHWYSTQGLYEEKTECEAAEFRALLDDLEDLQSDPRSCYKIVERLYAVKPTACLKDQRKFRLWRRKGACIAAVKAAGGSKAQGEAYAVAAETYYERCGAAYVRYVAAHAECILTEIARVAQTFSRYYRAEKRLTSALDFDDLISCAKKLLAEHEDIRCALAARYRHILVDEFQDTDPAQAEILWRLCGEGASALPWNERRLRAGSLFLVGDPKQAIYGFRGADIAIYQKAKTAMLAADPRALVEITANFRSHAGVLEFVNRLFAPLLDTARGQPGFTALTPGRKPSAELPQAPVTFLAAIYELLPQLEAAVRESSEDAEAVHVPALAHSAKSARTVSELRTIEASTVAHYIAQSIGQLVITDRHSGEHRTARAGDFALLAPRGTELHVYEAALDAQHIAVASGAGKNFYARQEVQDLVALMRTLADSDDTLALGAFLRGPLVGFSDCELADEMMPQGSTIVTKINLRADPAQFSLELRTVLEKLQLLQRRSLQMTPYAIVAQAFDLFDVRAIVGLRNPRRRDQSYANIERILHLAQSFDTRGFAAFAAALNVAWSTHTLEREGHPDTQADAVHMVTIHGAKGLEWPVVIPINALSERVNTSGSELLYDAQTGILEGVVHGVPTPAYEALQQRNAQAQEAEIIRLWYVALTRPREYLVIPQPLQYNDKNYFATLEINRSACRPLLTLPARQPSGPVVDADRVESPAHTPAMVRPVPPVPQLRIVRPSEHDASQHASRGVVQRAGPETASPWSDDSAATAVAREATSLGRLGTIRGTLLHKLCEELINGEVASDHIALRQRAQILAAQAGYPLIGPTATVLSADELAITVLQTFALPEIAALVCDLEAEVPLYSLAEDGRDLTLTTGVIDACTRRPNGMIDIVIDWKSDLEFRADQHRKYVQQLNTYLALTGAERGYIVYLTLAKIVICEADVHARPLV